MISPEQSDLIKYLLAALSTIQLFIKRLQVDVPSCLPHVGEMLPGLRQAWELIMPHTMNKATVSKCFMLKS